MKLLPATASIPPGWVVGWRPYAEEADGRKWVDFAVGDRSGKTFLSLLETARRREIPD